MCIRDSTDIPAEYQEVAEARREMMIDAIAETDDDIMMKYLEGEEISIEELKTALRKAVIANQLFPVLCGSSYKNKGVQMLLDAVVDYMPCLLYTSRCV